MKWTTWVAGAALFFGALAASAADEYTFVVINSTKSTISRLLVSEDGASWRPFNIGGGLRQRRLRVVGQGRLFRRQRIGAGGIRFLRG